MVAPRHARRGRELSVWEFLSTMLDEADGWLDRRRRHCTVSGPAYSVGGISCVNTLTTMNTRRCRAASVC